MPLPTKAEKSQFIADLIDSCHSRLLDRLDRVPDEWDGHELRQWIADTFAEQTSGALTGKRGREYRNAVVTLDL